MKFALGYDWRVTRWDHLWPRTTVVAFVKCMESFKSSAPKSAPSINSTERAEGEGLLAFMKTVKQTLNIGVSCPFFPRSSPTQVIARISRESRVWYL